MAGVEFAYSLCVSPQGSLRLRGFDYRGPYAYLVTICTHHRIRAFANPPFANHATSQLLRLCTEESIGLLAYCLMPDHAHLLVAGQDAESDPCRLVHRWKTVTGFAWRRSHATVLWQRGFHDRVLRDDDGLLPVARYVLSNPVRAGLVDRAAQYPFNGSAAFPLEIILAADEWSP